VTPASFAAGCLAGAAGQLVGHPLDTIKVHAQTQSSSSSGGLPLRTLFRGLAAPVLSAGAVQSVRLGLYESFRRQLTGGRSDAETPLAYVGVAAGGAGLFASLLMCPLQRIKTVQQLHGGALLPTVRALVRDGSLYRGLPAIFLFETNGIYLMCYVSIKRRLDAVNGPGQPMPLWQRIGAGATANVVAWACLYPIDSVRAVLQAGTPGAPPPKLGLLRSAAALVREAGIGRLYRGFGFTLLRAGPVAGVIMPVFDLLLAAFESSWSGGGAGPPSAAAAAGPSAAGHKLKSWPSGQV